MDPNLSEPKRDSIAANLQLVHFCKLTQAHCSERETRGIIVRPKQASDCASASMSQLILNICLWEESAIQHLGRMAQFPASDGAEADGYM